MNDVVHLSFRYEEVDYVRALRAHYKTRLHLRLDLVIVLLLIGAGLYLWSSPNLHWSGVVALGLAGFFVLLLGTAFFIIPPIAFRREPRFRDDYSLEFSAEGIHFRTAHIDSQLSWSLYSKALVDAHSFILYYGTNSFTLIPRRVFQSVEQRQMFEEMLSKHVAKILTVS